MPDSFYYAHVKVFKASKTVGPDPSTSASMCEEAFMTACQQLWSCVKADFLMHFGFCADRRGGPAMAWAWGCLCQGGKTSYLLIGYTGQKTSIMVVHGMCCTKFVTLVKSYSGRWGTMGGLFAPSDF